MNRAEQFDVVSKLGLMESIASGAFESDQSTTPQAPILHIVHKGSVAEYTPVASDNGAYMVFDYVGDLVVHLSAELSYPESNPFQMFIVNTKGRVDFVSVPPFIGYAPHASQNVTVGLLRGTENWYAVGTNNKEELS